MNVDGTLVVGVHDLWARLMRPAIGRPTISVGESRDICGHEFPGEFVHVDGIVVVCVCLMIRVFMIRVSRTILALASRVYHTKCVSDTLHISYSNRLFFDG